MSEIFAFSGRLANDLCTLFPWLTDHIERLEGVALFGQAPPKYLCFCDRLPSKSMLRANNSSVLLCTQEITNQIASALPNVSFVVLPDPRAAFIDFTGELLRHGLLSVTDLIPQPLRTSTSAKIGPNTVIDKNARIDDNAVVGATCVVHSGVWLQKDSVVGDGTVLGSTGINAYRGMDGRVRSFPHLAGVVIGEGVEIGSNAVVVKGILNSTMIGNSCVIGNLCNIGHGVEIGESCWMSAGCQIGGHTKIGNKGTIGLGAVIRDNLLIGENSQIGMGSVVTKHISENFSFFGNPARPVPPIKAGPNR